MFTEQNIYTAVYVRTHFSLLELSLPLYTDHPQKWLLEVHSLLLHRYCLLRFIAISVDSNNDPGLSMAVETSPLLQHNPPLCCMFPSILYLPKWLNVWLLFDASGVSFTVDELFLRRSGTFYTYGQKQDRSCSTCSLRVQTLESMTFEFSIPTH